MPWGGVNICLTPQAGGAQQSAPQPPEFDALCRGSSFCGSPDLVAECIHEMRSLLALASHIAIDHGGIPKDARAEALELFAAKGIPQVTAA